MERLQEAWRVILDPLGDADAPVKWEQRYGKEDPGQKRTKI
jgi:hypothetical protein